MSLRFFLQCPSTHLSCLLSTTLPLPNMKPSLKTIPSSAPGRQQELGSKALACLAHVIVPYPPHRLCSTSLPSSNPSHPVSLSLSLSCTKCAALQLCFRPIRQQIASICLIQKHFNLFMSLHIPCSIPPPGPQYHCCKCNLDVCRRGGPRLPRAARRRRSPPCGGGKTRDNNRSSAASFGMHKFLDRQDNFVMRRMPFCDL